jgi:Gram-negative bacterial TonB protein C-terminal
MSSLLGLENLPLRVKPGPGATGHRGPRLLVELEPWGRTFRRNLADFLWRRQAPGIATTSAPAPFWPDVFVSHRLPWNAFAESILYHGVVIAFAWGLSSLFASRPQIAKQRRFDPHDVIYYSPSEYLPPLDTGKSHAAQPRRGEPVYAKQPILSVPPEADNNRQTIVTPPNIKLTHDVSTPNIVAWGNANLPVPTAATERKPLPAPTLPSQIVAPAPDIDQTSQRSTASLSTSIVAPPPDVDPGKVRATASLSIDVVAPTPDAMAAETRRAVRPPQSAVVEPPPAVNAASVRKLGDINIGPSDVVAPAPQLPMAAQRSFNSLGGGAKAVVPPPPSPDASSTRGGSGKPSRGGSMQAGFGQADGQVVPPPPSVQGSRSSEGSGRLIALSINPSVAPPPTPPQGNRRGTFAAGPDGKPGAPGTPNVRGSSSTAAGGFGGNGTGSAGGSGSLNGAPPGLHVGTPDHAATSAIAGTPGPGGGNVVGNTPDPRASNSSDAPREIASASPVPRTHGPRVDLVENPTPLELKVFGGRKLYSMTLNMPNLNSAGGSWVIRFAELKDNADKPGDLSAPIAEHKVDPAYPIQLMEENVAGMVTLRAIIRADGSVADIHVVQDPDVRLGHYAADALSHWHFLPATKNGSNVDVEAIVMIPFKPILRRKSF